MWHKNERLGFLLNGLFWISLGVILIFYNEIFIEKLTYWLGGLVILYGIWIVLTTFLPTRKLHGIKSRILNAVNGLAHGLVGMWIIYLSPSIARWLSVGIGFYQFLIGLISLFNYYLLRKDRISGRLRYLIIGLINVFWGVGSFLSSDNIKETLIRLGIYIIFIGITSINDARHLFLTKDSSNILKRRIRIGVPVIFTMLVPARVLRQINKFINEELEIDENQLRPKQSETQSGEPVLKVFIHTSESGTTAMGHVDLSYKGQVYAYGNYDVDSLRLFGTVGDGSLFSIKEESYIEYCLDKGRTVFEFTVLLDNTQQLAFKKKLAEIKEIMIPWKLETKTQHESYVGIMAKRYQVETYKFSKSRFKTYFVLGTNCVMLADRLIGTSGLDLITMVGILSPGTYYDYFNQEYHKPNSLVVNSLVHHALSKKQYAL